MQSQLEKTTVLDSLVSTLAACLALFFSLVILAPSEGGWVIAGIATLIAAIPVFAFCLFGASILKKVNSKNLQVIIFSGLLVGLVLGLVGFAIASMLGFFDGLMGAFVLSGIAAGLCAAMLRINAIKNR